MDQGCLLFWLENYTSPWWLCQWEWWWKIVSDSLNSKSDALHQDYRNCSLKGTNISISIESNTFWYQYRNKILKTGINSILKIAYLQITAIYKRNWKRAECIFILFCKIMKVTCMYSFLPVGLAWNTSRLDFIHFVCQKQLKYMKTSWK